VPGFSVLVSELMDTQGFTKVPRSPADPKSCNGEVTARASRGSTCELVGDREISGKVGKTEVIDVQRS
jgi:hypothetical protein